VLEQVNSNSLSVDGYMTRPMFFAVVLFGSIPPLMYIKEHSLPLSVAGTAVPYKLTGEGEGIWIRRILMVLGH
jgi:hypothetical protein